MSMKMLTLGCSEGNNATTWYTRILNPRMQGLAGNPAYEAIVCRNAPKQGRAGGGLFTIDGYLAGICNYAEPESNQGLYATPRSIHDLLDRNGLAFLYAPKSVTEDRLDRLIRTAEEQLEKHESADLDLTLHRLRNQIEYRRRSLQAQLDALDGLYVRQRDDLLRRAAEARRNPVRSTSLKVNIAEPADRDIVSKPIESSADHETRLRVVEQKLDRMIQWMEETRTERNLEH